MRPTVSRVRLVEDPDPRDPLDSLDTLAASAPVDGMPYGIRRQTALVSVLVIAFTLLTGGVVMVAVLGAGLRDGVEGPQRARVTEAAALLSAEGLDALARPDARYLGAAGPLQVVDLSASGADGVVYTSFSTWDTPMSPLRPAPGELLVVDRTTVPHTEDPFVIVARGVRVEGREYAVLAAGRLASVDRALRQDALSLVVGVPLLSLLGGWAVWLLVSRTLRPVEQIRRAVEEISGVDVTGRVPVPPTLDEISRLARTMNALLDRIEYARESQRRFVADASHELRSPIAALGAGLEILADRPDELPDLLPLLETETRQLASLTDGLLLLARADAGTLRHRRVDVDVDDIVGAEAARLRTAGLLQVEAQVAAGRVVGDPDELHRAVRNLVDNACRFAATRVGLWVGQEQGEVVVHVDDDGPGIPPEERVRVFERFVRLDPARGRHHSGAGLGLPIVSSIVAAHGGSVAAEESPWGGARFTLRLPAAQVDVDLPAGVDQAGPGTSR